MTARNYSNTAPPTTLTASVTAGATSLPVASTAGYPAPPFTIGGERGTINEELMLVTAVPDGVTFTVTRGYDGTTAKAHNSGAGIEHTVGALDYREANTHVNDMTLHSFPTGMIVPYAGATAPTGWLLCDGSAISRTTYAALHALLKDATGANTYPYGAGDGSTTFNVPDLRGRFPLGKDNMGGTSANRVQATQADVLGQGAGTETVTLTTNELPAHTHTIDPHTHTMNPHNHTTSDHTHDAPSAAGSGASYYFVGGTSGSGPNAYTNSYTLTFTNYNKTGNMSGGAPNTGSTTTTAQATTATMQSAGAGAPSQNMPPYMAMNYIIKT